MDRGFWLFMVRDQSKALGVDDGFWIDVQTNYDIAVERDLHAHQVATKATAVVAS